MTAKVRRGLGLLALAPLGLVAFLLGRWLAGTYGDGAASTAGQYLALGGVLLLAYGVIAGCLNLATGLLSDS